MGQFGSLEQFALADQVQPVRDVVMDRALPFAEWIAAGDAAPGLLRSRLGLEARIDLVEHLDTLAYRQFLRFAARELQELQRLVDHEATCALQAARRRCSISESIEAALGLTSQKRTMNERRSSRTSWPQTLPVSA